MEILARQKQTWKWRLLFSDERPAALCPKGLDLIKCSHRLRLGCCTFHMNCVRCERLAQAAGSRDKTRRKWETSTTTWPLTQTRFKSKRNDNRAVLIERDEGVKRERRFILLKYYLSFLLHILLLMNLSKWLQTFQRFHPVAKQLNSFLHCFCLCCQSIPKLIWSISYNHWS